MVTPSPAVARVCWLASASSGGLGAFGYFVRSTQTQPTTLNFNPLLIGFNRGASGADDDSALADKLSFTGGFVMGAGGRGGETIGDMLNLGWTVVKVGYRYQLTGYILTDNAQYKSDIRNVAAGEMSWELAKYMYELQQDSDTSRGIIMMAIATGDMELAKAGALSLPQWEMLTISIGCLMPPWSTILDWNPTKKARNWGQSLLKSPA